ncbi:ArsR/SmtB family transcription factor [Desulfotomaculum sp. 1211_IL3151]
MRVGEIKAKTHLSRPAVSHHLKILKDIGIVKMREEGTKNFIILMFLRN